MLNTDEMRAEADDQEGAGNARIASMLRDAADEIDKVDGWRIRVAYTMSTPAHGSVVIEDRTSPETGMWEYRVRALMSAKDMGSAEEAARRLVLAGNGTVSP